MDDNDQSAGATPAAGGATPPQTQPASPAPTTPPAPPTPPATGDGDGMGDAGQRALAAERAAVKAEKKRADDAVKALEALQLASASDAEKAIAQAKKDGAAEITAKWSAQIRRSEVKAALTAAGINASILDLAVNAAEFAALAVTDDGELDGLTAAIDAFKKAKPDLFKAPVAPGSADGGNSGNGKTITLDQVKKMTPEEINAAFDRGELAGLLKPAG